MRLRRLILPAEFRHSPCGGIIYLAKIKAVWETSTLACRSTERCLLLLLLLLLLNGTRNTSAASIRARSESRSREADRHLC